LAKARRIKTLIDATLATPYNIKPLDLGIDLVVHSAIKYLGGHNDLMAGCVLDKQDIIQALRENQGMFGALPGPMTAYLLIRGLKTFPLRMRQVNESGQIIAEFLDQHPRVERVWCPGLASHPDHAIASRDMHGFGGVVSFTVAGDLKATKHVVDACRIPHLAPHLWRPGKPDQPTGRGQLPRPLLRAARRHRHTRQPDPLLHRLGRRQEPDDGFGSGVGVKKPCRSRQGFWWARQDLNPQPSDYESPALTN
jgi:O-acetylhomoserine/O-acetylserine sulfhydrylase-like pyridoxal-dependent enzyme